MQVEVKYFGMLAEITGCNSEQLVISSPEITGLKEVLLNKYPDFVNKDFRIAQNQELVSDTALLTGEEIAVLPPFAGG